MQSFFAQFYFLLDLLGLSRERRLVFGVDHLIGPLRTFLRRESRGKGCRMGGCEGRTLGGMVFNSLPVVLHRRLRGLGCTVAAGGAMEMNVQVWIASSGRSDTVIPL